MVYRLTKVSPELWQGGNSLLLLQYCVVIIIMQKKQQKSAKDHTQNSYYLKNTVLYINMELNEDKIHSPPKNVRILEGSKSFPSHNGSRKGASGPPEVIKEKSTACNWELQHTV